MFISLTQMPCHMWIDQLKLHVLDSANTEKRQKYLEATEACWALFTPFVQSVDGVFSKEAQYLLRRLAEKLSH